ncbi:transcriptional regulatory protein [Phlyctema vagabunda]|uniref:Transcriptional regulatory protein n=1 Tax=Phlyctema vagabunda TaxID=108571 RepID=A0ABR4PD98_9HELO
MKHFNAPRSPKLWLMNLIVGDGLKPTCSTCARAGNTNCIYDNDASTLKNANPSTTSGPGATWWKKRGDRQGPSHSSNGSNASTTSPNSSVPPQGAPNTETETSNQAAPHSTPLDILALQARTFSSISTNQEARQEYQSPYQSPKAVTQASSDSTEIFNFDNVTMEYPLDIDGSSIADNLFCDPWIFDSSIPDLNGEFRTYSFNKFVKEPPSRMKTLTERLFPTSPKDISDIPDAPSGLDKHRTEYGMDSSIFSLTLDWFNSLSPNTLALDTSVESSVNKLIKKLRTQPTQIPTHEKDHFREETTLSQTSLPVLHSYIKAFFEHPLSCYSSIEDAHEWLGAYFSTDLSARLSVEPLLNAIAAIGCRTLNAKSSSNHSQADDYFSAALAARGRLLEGESSVLKIQSLVTMALYLYGSREDELTWSIVSNAVQLSLMLRLNKSRDITNLSQSNHDAGMLRQLFWVIYAIEKPLVMQLNRYSLIEDTSVDYAPELQPDCASTYNTDKLLYLLHLVHYAKICSMIMKSLYSFSKSQQRKDLIPTIRQIKTLLIEWKECLPDSLQVLPQGFKLVPGMMPHQMRDMVSFTLKYHEAMMVIHQRGEMCVQSARSIFSLMHFFECDQSNLNWANCRLPIAAYIMLLINILEVSKPQVTKDNMPYLIIANGWYGRLALSLDWDFGFTELMELSQVAQRIWTIAQNN